MGPGCFRQVINHIVVQRPCSTGNRQSAGSGIGGYFQVKVLRQEKAQSLPVR
jgi:hypothetical protein